MKLRNVLLALALVAVPTAAQAQLKTASLTTTGTVASAVTASAVGTTINFATMVNGNNAATGEFTVSSNQDVSLSVVFTDMVNGTTALPVTASCMIGADAASATTAFASGCAAESFSFIGARTVLATGTVNIADVTAIPAGTYTGTATFNATYTAY